MNANALPAVFAFLEEERNLAVDAALAEALPHMEPRIAEAALQLIIDRDQLAGLGRVVGGFHGYGEGLQSLILSRVDDLYGGVRAAMGSGLLDARLSAIEIIELGNECKLAYLLGASLRGRCRKTRKRSAETLNKLTDRYLQFGGADRSPEGLAESANQEKCLCDALHHGLMSWEAHVRPEILEAALWLSDRLEETIRLKLQEQRTHIAYAINSTLEGATDPRLAGFALRALAIPALRGAAILSIGQARDTEFIRGLASECWALADPEIRRACVRLRELHWLNDDVDILATLEVHEAAALVRLIGATGLKSEPKVAVYRAILGLAEEELDMAVVWQLVEDKGPSATDLLTTIAGRAADGASRVAARELKRRGLDSFMESETTEEATAGQAAAGGDRAGNLWDKFWRVFDRLSADQRAGAGEELRGAGFDILVALRAKLADSAAPERAKALRVASSVRAVEDLSEQVYRLTSDPDAFVRSTAVNLLAELPGTTSRRILQRAMDDPDDRVQANAITALDALEVQGRQAWIEPKLESSDNRVRANAVKSLLEMELQGAGEVLLDMLEDHSRASRLSALWVIERLQLQTVIHRIEKLSHEDPDKRVRQRARRVMRGLSGLHVPQLGVSKAVLPAPTAGNIGRAS